MGYSKEANGRVEKRFGKTKKFRHMERMEEQTAVIQLTKKLFGDIGNVPPDIQKLIREAEKIEAKQMIDFAENYFTFYTCSSLGRLKKIEDYYNETFKSE